jgi:peptidoglycan/LPS O-acetylase OafA/YrhL
MSEKKLYFFGLDGLRTIACLMVVISHSGNYIFEFFCSRYNNFLFKLVKDIFVAGGEGVSIFFVLSGFLITYLLLIENNKTNSINVSKFYIRRILRIWPLFYFVVFFGLFIFPIIAKNIGLVHSQNGDIWMNIFFLNNFDLLNLALSDNTGFNPHLQITWSVAIEEQFYLVWPILFYIFRNKGFVLLCVSLFLLHLSFYKYIDGNETIFYFHTIGQMNNLVFGSLTAYLLFKNEKVKSYFGNQKESYRILIYFMGLLLFAFRKEIIDILDLLIIRYLLMIFYSYVIVDLSFNIKSKLFKFKESSFWVKNGKYTYGQYLLHPICLLFIKQSFDFMYMRTEIDWLFRYKENILSSFLLLIFTLISTYLVSALSYYKLEKPFLKLKEKFTLV